MYVIGLENDILRTISVYKGYITASGGGNILPPGWSVVKTLPNTYEIFHNLNLVNITDLLGSFSAYSTDGDAYFITPISATKDSIVLKVKSSINGDTIVSFGFIAFKY